MQRESWFWSLLRACLPLPRLSEFYCYFAIVSGAQDFHDHTQDELIMNVEEALETLLLEAIAARSSETGCVDTKIKAIRFPNQKESDSIRMMLPIMSSSLVEIETFEIPVLIDPRGEDFYEEIARKHCPGLRHLILPPYHCQDHPAAVCSFIRGATGLKTVRGRRCSGGYHDSRSTKIISTLVAHHFRTLEELEFTGCEMINRTDQQMILATCKNLKRFWITPDGKYNQELGLRYQDVVDREWACLGLKELCLSLDRTIYDQPAKVAIQESLQAARAQRLSMESEGREQEEQEEQEDDLDQLGEEEQQRQIIEIG
ncbi:hypothetical protein BGZ68_003893 [Mortierella alpina]|nr:hypothetical protein BGZ68_003893 [Mortierella alpina]